MSCKSSLGCRSCKYVGCYYGLVVRISMSMSVFVEGPYGSLLSFAEPHSYEKRNGVHCASPSLRCTAWSLRERLSLPNRASTMIRSQRAAPTVC